MRRSFSATKHNDLHDFQPYSATMLSVAAMSHAMGAVYGRAGSCVGATDSMQVKMSGHAELYTAVAGTA